MSENQPSNSNSSEASNTNASNDPLSNQLNESATNSNDSVDKARPPIKKTQPKVADPKPAENKVVKLLEKNHLGMTLPEMAGGTRQLKRIRTLRPVLAEAIKSGLVMPVSQRAGHTVYKLVKNMGPR